MLTRAIFWYVGPVILILGLLFCGKERRVQAVASLLIMFSLAYSLSGLWVWRNYEIFGESSIASARLVVPIRAEYTYMTPTEHALAYVMFAPRLGPYILEKYFPKESYEKLQRKNPQGYYKLGKNRIGRVAEFTGKEKPSVKEMNRAARKLILKRWPKNLALVPLFAYRGAMLPVGFGYKVINKHTPYLGAALRLFSMPLLLCLVPAMLVLSVKALFEWRNDWLIFLTPSLFSFALHSGVTHHIPRYSQPLIPCLIVALIGLIWMIRSTRQPT